MFYRLCLACGCTVYVVRDPITGVAQLRELESRGSSCTDRRHALGARLWLWEILPEPQRPEEPPLAEV